jgi:uncharacterized protein (TIGR02145 family)
LVSRNYRKLFKGDETSAIPEVKSYLGSFKQLLTEWAKLKSKLPFTLGYQPENPAAASTFTSKSFLVHSDHLSISDISNPKVTNSVKKEGGRLKVNFKTTESIKQLFRFKINYDNTINGKLSQDNDATLTITLTFTDVRDGNVYNIVKIGTQTWFAENLRYAGNIPQVTSEQAWLAILGNGNPTNQPAWAYFNNDPNKNEVYGKLYNWNAVNTGTICPPGWHIPTDTEWTTLINFLGGEGVAGGKMKSVTGWGSPNVEATNESGFTALPGGLRDYSGEFRSFESSGHWWSSTQFGPRGALSRGLLKSEGRIDKAVDEIVAGLSCRCLKD